MLKLCQNSHRKTKFLIVDLKPVCEKMGMQREMFSEKHLLEDHKYPSLQEYKYPSL